jgi:hypothetical protein
MRRLGIPEHAVGRNAGERGASRRRIRSSVAIAAVSVCLTSLAAGGQQRDRGEAERVRALVAAPHPTRMAYGVEARAVPEISSARRDPGERGSATIRFDQRRELPETLLRVLMRRSPNDPAWNPSPFQTGPARVLVSGRIGDGPHGVAFRDVWLRVVDGGPAADYDAASVVDDNIGAVELRGLGDSSVTRAGSGVWHTTTDANGRFRAEGWFVAREGRAPASGDDFYVEASPDAEFSCGGSCARSGVFRLWKRIYVERDAMYRVGASIEREAAAGSTRLAVDDVTPFLSARRDRPIEVLLMHAPWVETRPAPAFLRENPGVQRRHEEPNLVVGVVRPDKTRPEGALELAVPTLRWLGPEPGSPSLRDAVVVPGEGLFDPPPVESARRAFAKAFVDVVELPNPSPRVPHGIFDAERRGEDFSAFAQKWSDYSWVAAPGAVNTVLVVAADHKTAPGAKRGLEMHRSIGTCHAKPAHVASVFLWLGSIERQVKSTAPGRGIGGKAPMAVADELLAHELAHSFGVDDSQGVDRWTRLNTDGTGLSTMHFPVGPEMGDGIVGFHVAEYLGIRQRRDPLPQ